VTGGRPPPGEVLCGLDEIEDPGAKGFDFRDGSALFSGFVVRRGESVVGYVDSCPHLGWPIAAMNGRYLTRSGDLIICSGHGAVFQLDDGLCIGGPCGGRRLTPWPVRVEDGRVVTA
jgi:nitrite reductase/ring-hydroxylating ferredoxin subunit